MFQFAYTEDGRYGTTNNGARRMQSLRHNPYVGSFSHALTRQLRNAAVTSTDQNSSTTMLLGNRNPLIGTFRHSPAIAKVEAKEIILQTAQSVTTAPFRNDYSHLSLADLKSIPVSKFAQKTSVEGSNSGLSDPFQDDFPTCVICLEMYVDGDELRTLPCGHCFHKKCVDRWLFGYMGGSILNSCNCPQCRQAAFPSRTNLPIPTINTSSSEAEDLSSSSSVNISDGIARNRSTEVEADSNIEDADEYDEERDGEDKELIQCLNFLDSCPVTSLDEITDSYSNEMSIASSSSVSSNENSHRVTPLSMVRTQTLSRPLNASPLSHANRSTRSLLMSPFGTSRRNGNCNLDELPGLSEDAPFNEMRTVESFQSFSAMSAFSLNISETIGTLDIELARNCSFSCLLTSPPPPPVSPSPLPSISNLAAQVGNLTGIPKRSSDDGDWLVVGTSPRSSKRSDESTYSLCGQPL